MLAFIGVMVAGVVLLLRREHRILSDESEPPTLNTRGPDD